MTARVAGGQMCRLVTPLDAGHQVRVRGSHQRASRCFIEVHVQLVAGVRVSEDIFAGLQSNAADL